MEKKRGREKLQGPSPKSGIGSTTTGERKLYRNWSGINTTWPLVTPSIILSLTSDKYTGCSVRVNLTNLHGISIERTDCASIECRGDSKISDMVDDGNQGYKAVSPHAVKSQHK